MTEVNGTDSIIIEDESLREYRVFQLMMKEFQSLTPQSREKLLKTISTYFDIKLETNHQQKINQTQPFTTTINSIGNTQRTTSFSEDRTISPKEFLFQKSPQTDVERVVCLAFYLTHYRDQKEFKTLDISTLNTEAAQIKFSNPTVAMDNATNQSNFLAPTTKGNKQITTLGELYVQALPDREKAKEVIKNARPKRKQKRQKLNNVDEN